MQTEVNFLSVERELEAISYYVKQTKEEGDKKTFIN
jgi:hypothetical protein